MSKPVHAFEGVALPERITAVALIDSTLSAHFATLDNRIQLNRVESLEHFSAAIGTSTSDVGLLDVHCPQISDSSELVTALKEKRIPILAVVAGGQALSCLASWADAVVEPSPGSNVTLALWSLYVHRANVDRLKDQILALKGSIAQRKRIAQVVSIIAKQSGISESEALKNLRREARQKRRSMHELATIVIEAHQIVANMAQKS